MFKQDAKAGVTQYLASDELSVGVAMELQGLEEELVGELGEADVQSFVMF